MAWQSYGHNTMKGRQRRETPREPTNRSGVLHYKGTRIPVVLEDISRTGAKVKLPPTSQDDNFEEDIQLEIPGLMKLPVDLRWRSGASMGAQFSVKGPRLAMLGSQIKST